MTLKLIREGERIWLSGMIGCQRHVSVVNCLGILLAFCVLLSHSVFCVFGFGKVTQICIPVLSFGESYAGMLISMLGGGLLGDFLQFHKNSPVLPRNIKFTE